MQEEQTNEPFDLDEDLFDFDEVAREHATERGADEDLEQIFATFRGEEREDPLAEERIVPLEMGLAPSPAASAPPPEPEELEEPEPAIVPARMPQPRAPLPARAAPTAAHARARSAHATAEEVPAAPRRPFLSRGMVAIALSVTVLNGLLAVVLLRGNARMRDEVRAVGHEVAGAADGATETQAGELGPALADPGEVFDAEAHPAFVEARDEIARGEYASARQRIYALLAIIDRLEDPRRGAVEAEAQFVLAQTLHLEALERMGSSR